MKRQILMVVAGLVILAGASNVQAFELFRGRHLGHGCCAAEVSCCEEAPTCCEAAPVACCDEAPACGCDAEPSCGCDVDPCCRRPGLFARLHAKKMQWWAGFKH